MSKKSKNISNQLPSIKVRVKLRQGQYTGVMNKWICTIHGEKREVTMRDVEWYCMNVEDAVHSFKESEIESFSIVGQYIVEPCVR
jgi:transcriptional regulator NrdR family protein